MKSVSLVSILCLLFFIPSVFLCSCANEKGDSFLAYQTGGKTLFARVAFEENELSYAVEIAFPEGNGPICVSFPEDSSLRGCVYIREEGKTRLECGELVMEDIKSSVLDALFGLLTLDSNELTEITTKKLSEGEVSLLTFSDSTVLCLSSAGNMPLQITGDGIVLTFQYIDNSVNNTT